MARGSFWLVLVSIFPCNFDATDGHRTAALGTTMAGTLFRMLRPHAVDVEHRDRPQRLA